MNEPSFAWSEEIDGTSFSHTITADFAKIIHWKRNLFHAPSGKAGISVVNTLASLFRALSLRLGDFGKHNNVPTSTCGYSTPTHHPTEPVSRKRKTTSLRAACSRNRTGVFHASSVQHIQRDGKWCHCSIQTPRLTPIHQERATLQYSDELASLPPISFLLLHSTVMAFRGSCSRCGFVPHEDTHFNRVIHEDCVLHVDL